MAEYDAQHESSLTRYHRQMLLPGFGETGQQRLREAHTLIVGCGALGSAIADSLCRAGIGELTIVDRDVVEWTNLQRQSLFDENDVKKGIPKAEAAKARLKQVNSHVTINAIVADFNASNAERFAQDADIIMDGLDNFETRYLLNDLAVARGMPYVYGGAVGTTGMAMTILPHGSHARPDQQSEITWSDDDTTACLRCIFPEAPPPGTTPTCDTIGVLGPLVNMIAAHQSTAALKILTGNIDALDRSLLSVDLWNNTIRQFNVNRASDEQCVCCGQRRFEYLSGEVRGASTALCGRNAVQITPAGGEHTGTLDLPALVKRLNGHGEFTSNRFLLRGTLTQEQGDNNGSIELTVFPDGRAIVKGTDEPDRARNIYDKYVGS